MDSSSVTEQSAHQECSDGPVINDLVVDVATANGSGSQSANLILARTIFKMGVPVGCKNLFPSNIQGLPTWFNVRANAQGWTARRERIDIMVCMNKETIREDVERLMPGTLVLVRDDLQSAIERKDLHVIAAPFAKLVVDVCPVPRLRKMVVNIMYVGVLAYLLRLDTEILEEVIAYQFDGKEKAIEINRTAAQVAYQWAKENLVADECPYKIESIDAAKGKILVEGNEAAAIGALFGGATVMGWYPITPSSSIAEHMIALTREYRHDPETGKATYAIIQAEDELASIGMVIGAGWAGARAFTATSGPGISLMAEQAGLAYFAEIPSVIIDVQRMGPSTGLPTRTCAGDITKAYYLSHGDCKHLMLLPSSMTECFEFTCESFNVAERFQTLVFVMLDLDQGMNYWMCDPFKMPEKPINRGKVLDADALEKLESWGRYRDVDGDGIPWRTVPGTPHPKAAYFTRGTGHTPEATYSEKPDDWKDNLDRLVRKFETAREELPAPVVKTKPGATVGVIAYGSADPAVSEAVEMLDERHGVKVDYLRVRALPPHQSVFDFIHSHEVVVVVDMNRDAQMLSILHNEERELYGKVTNLESIVHYNGMAIDAETVQQGLLSIIESRQQASKG